MDLVRTYYYLVKPGIVRGNLLSATAGFLFASRGNIDFGLGFWLLFGTSAIIASACVFNNIFDRNIDAKMKRTRKRALVSGKISTTNARIFGSMLFALGVSSLYFFVGKWTLIVGLIGFLDYVYVYTPLKPRTHHATLLGGISGATPPVAGYVAVTGTLDTTSLVLFLILLFWQMPHFFAIALFREAEYKSARIPIHPLVKGIRATKIQMLLYTAAFFLACISLAAVTNVSKTFLLSMTALSIYWLWHGLRNFELTDVVRWAKGMFGISLLVLLAFSVVLGLDFWLP
ncbi:heme o synthase [Candidatus Saccharibacteria bacterium]|nr:heme o synthase [Candidatus Saccharibacteria bacterium]MCA9328694.1 heme o synthase [Candidatus Saccharibacteria bacterium]